MSDPSPEVAAGTAQEPRYTIEQFHERGCPAIADDESDYVYLHDAGTCVCGALTRAVIELNRLAALPSAPAPPQTEKQS
jgi:hypothetical protein